MGLLRRALHRFIPAHFQDPVGLARRLYRSGDPAARFAMGSALAGVALTPLDLALTVLERRRMGAAEAPALPMLLVCGPPRSGTTLLAQVLIGQLPVAYFNNLTSLFPRSPITAAAFLGGLARPHGTDLHNYYGRSRALAGANDALYIWDRWLGRDRTTVPDTLSPAQAAAMRRFFGAFERQAGRPIVAKNNNLNASAHLVAGVLPSATFLCLERDPRYLAQSLLKARREIHGTDTVPYGVHSGGTGQGAVESVCRQVLYHQSLARDQVARLGHRFRMVSYEDFCRDPAPLVAEAAGILGLPVPDQALPAIAERNRVTVDPAEFAAIESTLARLETEQPR